MANSLIMSYVLKQVKNIKSPVKDRWFAYVNRTGLLTTRGLANHMVEHGMTNKADVLAMLAKLSECVPELVSQGYSVKLDGIGIFYPVIANNKGGAESPGEFSVTQNIKGVRFRFKPDSTDLDDLTTKAFGKKVTFGQGYYQTETGKKAPKIPLVAFEP
jgi:predicted histone-like DNA-binding protein